MVRFPLTLRVFIAAALLLIGGLAAAAPADLVMRPARKGSRSSVVIDSAPQQAAVYLDDKKYGVVGYTPYKGKLVRGKYKLILARDGFVDKVLEIEVSRSQRKFFGVLEKLVLPATVAVSAAADKGLVGGYVHIDGKYIGKVPLETQVPAGRHQVIIQRKGFKHFSQWVELKPGERMQLAPALKRLSAPPGSLLVDASVAGAEVWVNGKKHPDGTPTVIEGLAPGMHAVEVRVGKKGAETLAWKKLVEIKSGQRVKVRATAPAPVKAAATPPTTPAPTAPAKPAGVGTVRILSSVANAQVKLDGKVMGTSPADPKRGLDIKFVPVGEHQVSATLADGRIASAKVTVVKDTLVQVALAPALPQPAAPVSGPKGRLKVTASVEGAHVKVDGKPVGTAPLEMDLPVGEHQVLVSAPGAKPVAQGARIAAGMLTTIDAQLMLGLPNSPMVGKQRDSDLQPVDPAAGKPTAANAPEAKVPEAKAPPVAQQGAALTGPPAPLEPYHPEHGMRSTRGGRPLAKGQVNLDLAAGYPYWLNLRAVVGIANERQAALDMLLAYRSALLFHEVQAGGRYRFMGDGPLQLAALVAVGAGGNSGGRNNFSLAAGVAATLVFGDKVALSGRLEVDVWSDLLCGEVVQSADATSDTSKGCQVDKDDKPIDAAADGLTSGGADLRDNGLRLLGGVALEIAISQTTNIFAAVDRRLAGNEKRAGFSSSFNSLMVLDDDPGWLGSAGVSFGF